MPDWLRLYVCRCTRGCQRAPTRDRPATADVLQLVFASARSVIGAVRVASLVSSSWFTTIRYSLCWLAPLSHKGLIGPSLGEAKFKAASMAPTAQRRPLGELKISRNETGARAGVPKSAPGKGGKLSAGVFGAGAQRAGAPGKRPATAQPARAIAAQYVESHEKGRGRK